MRLDSGDKHDMVYLRNDTALGSSFGFGLAVYSVFDEINVLGRN